MKAVTLIFFYSLLVAPSLFAGVVLPIFENRFHAMDFELDAYYSSLDYYLTPFGETNTEVSLKEEQIYKEFLNRFLVPHSIILEASGYPLAAGGGLTRKYLPTVYQAAQFTSNFNIIKSLTITYKEPYAFTLFLGNYIKFKPNRELVDDTNTTAVKSFFKEEAPKTTGLAYAGLSFTFGPTFMINNNFIDYPWLESQINLKGTLATTEKKLRWNFKVGYRHTFGFVSNDVTRPIVEGVAFISLSRDRVDFNSQRFSLVNNTRYEFRMDKGIGDNNFWRFTFMFGKNFPIKGARLAPSIAIGTEININSPYDSRLTGLESQSLISFIIQPGIKF